MQAEPPPHPNSSSSDITPSSTSEILLYNFQPPMLGSFQVIRRRVLKLLYPASSEESGPCNAYLQALYLMLSGRTVAAQHLSEERQKLLRIKMAHAILLFPGLPHCTADDEQQLVRDLSSELSHFSMLSPRSPVFTPSDTGVRQAHHLRRVSRTQHSEAVPSPMCQ